MGCYFDNEERDLLRALSWLKSKLRFACALELAVAIWRAPNPGKYDAHLQRMALAPPRGLRQRVQRRLLLAGLRASS